MLLQRLADAESLKIHIVIRNLQPAGDPLALAERAVLYFDKENRKAPLAGKAILLDADRLSDPPDRGRRACALLQQEGFLTIWQKPDHEGLLLRHFAGHDHDDPARGRSMAALQAVWPEYHKNMAAVDLHRQLSLDHITRAAGVTQELMKLLRMIGLCRI